MRRVRLLQGRVIAPLESTAGILFNSHCPGGAVTKVEMVTRSREVLLRHQVRRLVVRFVLLDEGGAMIAGYGDDEKESMLPYVQGI